MNYLSGSQNFEEFFFFSNKEYHKFAKKKTIIKYKLNSYT